MKKYRLNILAIIMALLETIFIWHNLLVSGNNVVFFVILLGCYFFIIKTFENLNKRKIIIVSIISIVFSLMEIICKSINIDYTLNNIIDKWLIINLLGYFIIAWGITIYIFNLFEKHGSSITNKIKENNIFSNNKIIFFICIILILLCWLPYFLRYYPGIVTSDSYSQIEQTIGLLPLSDHHPIAHTAIIGIFINIGLGIFKNINSGIALYSIFSMIAMATMDSIVLLYLKKKNVPIYFLIITLLYYMFYPINAIYSITMWKDILFSGIVPIFIILCIELVLNTEQFFIKKSNSFIYFFIAILTIYLRHNGLYAVFFTIPFIFIVLKRYWKKTLPIFVGIFISYIILNFFIYNIIKVQRGSIGEALSIPLQQLARVEKYHKEELDEDILNKINNFFVIENIGEQYTPTLSDSVKSKFNLPYFNENKSEFLKYWLKLLAKYPKDYVESFISNSYGYYYPEALNNAVSRATMDHNMGIEQSPRIQGKIVEFVDSMIDRRNIPILSMIFSIGIVFWITVICIFFKIYQKEYKYIIIYLPIFVLWLTMIASPAFCECRYAYPIFTTLPIYIAFNIIEKEKKK